MFRHCYNISESTDNIRILVSPTSYDIIGRNVLNLGDVNGDGYEDFAVSKVNGEIYVWFGKKSAFNYGSYSVVPNSGDGFRIIDNYYNLSASPIIGCDLNGDGKNEIIVQRGRVDKVDVIYGKNFSGTNVINLDQDSSSFITITKVLGNSFACANLNKDQSGTGKELNDLIIGSPVNNKVYVIFGQANIVTVNTGISWTNNGRKGFEVVGNIGYYIDTGDFNRDGNTDIAIASNLKKVYILYGTGGVFQSSYSISQFFGSVGRVISGPVTFPFNVKFCSLSGSQRNDLLIRSDDKKLYVFYGNSSPVNSTTALDGNNGFVIDLGSYTRSFDCADFDFDGKNDIAVGVHEVNNAGAVYVFNNAFFPSNSTIFSAASLNGTNGFILNGLVNFRGGFGYSIETIEYRQKDYLVVGAPINQHSAAYIVGFDLFRSRKDSDGELDSSIDSLKFDPESQKDENPLNQSPIVQEHDDL